MKLRLPSTAKTMRVLAVLLVVAGAAVIWQHLPTPLDTVGPFDVYGEAGTPTAGREVSADVTGVRIAPEVDSEQATGIWVVVDVTLEAPHSTVSMRADLIAGPNTYTLDDRFMIKWPQQVNPGIAQSASWVFDVVPELVAPGAGSITLRVISRLGEPLNSRLVIRIPLDDARVSRTDTVTLEAPTGSTS
jgi:hypothetical protein